MIALHVRVVYTSFTLHTHGMEFPLLCTFYKLEPGKWSCEPCLGVRPADDPDHIVL